MVTVINMRQSTQYRNFEAPTLSEIMSETEYQGFQRREIVVIDQDLNLINNDETLKWIDTVYITNTDALRDHLEHKLDQLEKYLEAVETYEVNPLKR